MFGPTTAFARMLLLASVLNSVHRAIYLDGSTQAPLWLFPQKIRSAAMTKSLAFGNNIPLVAGAMSSPTLHRACKYFTVVSKAFTPEHYMSSPI